jgi:hypothetical protein
VNRLQNLFHPTGWCHFSLGRFAASETPRAKPRTIDTYENQRAGQSRDKTNSSPNVAAAHRGFRNVANAGKRPRAAKEKKEQGNYVRQNPVAPGISNHFASASGAMPSQSIVRAPNAARR